MSEMTERVTKAILPAFDHIPDKEYRLTIAGCWARAAVEAMRSPTIEMLSAAEDLKAVSKGVVISASPYDAWQAMIDEALK